ncbi:hypothetical protein DXX92_05395 [Thalassotalea euphylliae]|uniref:Glycosyltransferase n=2 Tax=Thalassotalea euphylliae TaxID=1655234 RepID=A0A3E0UDD6_9GAMM|nr:hypothetical protein DXX92_05395 [Thalassotalea euphylliae]
MSTTINFLANAAQELGKLNELEIVVADWGSDEKLVHALSLSQAGAQITRFIYVSQEITSRYKSNALPGNIGANIALRRAKGKLVSISGAEILVPARALEALFKQAEKSDYQQRLIVCGRFRLPAQWVLAQPCVLEWQGYLERNSWQLAKEPGRGSFLTGNAGLFVFPQEMLHESTGLFEALDPYWGWNDVEYTMRALSRYQSVDLHSEGVTVFDMEHFHFAGTRNTVMKKIAPRLLSQSFNANGNDWGAGLVELECSKAEPKVVSNGATVVSKNELEKLLPEIELSRFQSFFTWFCDYVEEELSVGEIHHLVSVFNIVKNRNILRFKEFGCTNGFSYYLMHFLFEHLNSVGADHWLSGGGEWGPDHMVYNLTTPGMGHKGQAVLVNHSLEADNRLASKLVGANGLVIFRTDSAVEWSAIENEVYAELANHDLILIGECAEKIIESLKKQLPSLSKVSCGDLHYFSHEPIALAELEKNVELIPHLNQLAHNSSNWGEHSAEVLMEEIAKLDTQEIVLWYFDEAQFRLIWPHVENNVVAVINSSKHAAPVEIVDKLISQDKLSIYDHIKVIRLN